MERAIGEIFEFEGEILKVATSGRCCSNCYFENKDGFESCKNYKEIIGECCSKNREDKKYVVFEEQE